MNTTLTLTEIMNCLGADMLPNSAPNEKTQCWIAPVVFHEGDGSPQLQDHETQMAGDIYELMSGRGTKMAGKYDALALYTCGWAAPNDDNDEIAPSLHPKRKRVALLCLVTKDGQFGSAMKMYDNPEAPDMMIENEGRGMLRDSAVAMWDDYK